MSQKKIDWEFSTTSHTVPQCHPTLISIKKIGFTDLDFDNIGPDLSKITYFMNLLGVVPWCTPVHPRQGSELGHRLLNLGAHSWVSTSASHMPAGNWLTLLGLSDFRRGMSFFLVCLECPFCSRKVWTEILGIIIPRCLQLLWVFGKSLASF